MRNRYKPLISMMKFEKEVEKMFIKEGAPDQINDFRREYVRKIRDELRRIDSNYIDPLEKPLSEAWRCYCDEDGEDGYHFRILKVENPDDWTDEEIEEYILDEVGYPPICSPYDCTGKRFTAWTSWSRQPAGIVMIHSWGLDV